MREEEELGREMQGEAPACESKDAKYGLIAASKKDCTSTRSPMLVIRVQDGASLAIAWRCWIIAGPGASILATVF